jgi:hypothetical protein
LGYNPPPHADVDLRKSRAEGAVVRLAVPRFAGITVFLLGAWASASAQSEPCHAGFEISQSCIRERALDQKVAVYQRKITEAMVTLGASYKITLRVVNHPIEAGYNAETVGDVFTEVVRNEEMRNQSFIINVTANFLEKQPDILFEASALHEVCHVMNDDLTGYHRNGANTEVAEEHCVLKAVGETRYVEYLRAYATYRDWDAVTYERFLQSVKALTLVPAPRELDEADRIAAEYFRTLADGDEHFLIYNGDLHDITLYSTRDWAWLDAAILKAVISAGRPMIFFHNHPAPGRAAMFPSYDDFAVAGLFSFMVYRDNPGVALEFRVVQLGEENASVSYGLKGTALEDIRALAMEHRNAIDGEADVTPIELRLSRLYDGLAQDSFSEYLQYVCPVDPRTYAEVCLTHPQYFIWPSDRFFIRYRPR